MTVHQVRVAPPQAGLPSLRDAAVESPAPLDLDLGEMVGEVLEPVSDLLAYQRDLWERSILFLDALRQRADDLLAHQRAGKPPLLDFDYELILDARRFDEPTNYDATVTNVFPIVVAPTFTG